MEGDIGMDMASSGLSEHATEQLINLLIKRGYFHDGLVETLKEEQHEESLEAMMRSKEKKGPFCSEKDTQCQLISTRDNSFVTRSQLRKELYEELQASGRLSFEDGAVALAVDVADIELTASALSSDGNIESVGSELVTSEYLDEVATGVESKLSLEGHVRISQLAEAICVPTEAMTRVLSERLDRGIIRGKLVTVGGIKELESPRHEESERKQVCGVFCSLTMPTPLEFICHEFGWEITKVLPLIRNVCSTFEVPGELHESGSASGALYVPNIYLAMQRQSIDGFFASNGYITVEKCVSMGVIASKMGEYVQQSFPSAVVLPGSVINKDVIASPLEVVIQDSISSKSFVDLKMHLPEDYTDPKDIGQIVNSIILPRLTKDGETPLQEAGMCIATDGEALFFSTGMIRHISKAILPPLVEAYGKSRAEEIDRSTTVSSFIDKKRTMSIGSNEDDHRRGRTKRRKGKKAGGKKAKAPSEDTELGVVPLSVVAKQVASDYPDLADIQDSFGPLVKDGEGGAPTWEKVSGLENANDSGACGPLYEFCREALYTPKLQEESARAVKAELERIQSARQAISVSSRKEGAAKVRGIEHAFEDISCFPTACYVIQMLGKFIHYVSTSEVDSHTMTVIKTDALQGFCADFTRRITEFCFFKNEIEEGIFSFHRNNPESISEQAHEAGLPLFCHPIQTSARSYPNTFLSCSRGEEGELREPLPMIRKLLPGTVGVALARMWTLCGGVCYDGGTGSSQDGAEYTRPGDFDGFMKHAEDSCLTICGLPFKKLDKKSEKQAMFSRRQQLTQSLEAATEGKVVLDLTVMLLFQQVKGFFVSGTLLSGPILMLLAKEKKVPAGVSTLLNNLADSLKGTNESEKDLVNAVRACGLSRDISKHQVE